MTAPTEIWIDARVVRTMPQEPSPDMPEGTEQLRYFSYEKVQELLRMSSSAEFIISMQPHPIIPDIMMIGLSNYGRLFYYELESQTWGEPVDGPDLVEVQS